jgi:hypothetical protein
MPMQPAAVLGPGHPLVRAAESRDVLGGHAIAVLAALLCGAAAALANEIWGPPVVIGAAATLAGLGVSALKLRARVRRHALELVLEGHEALPLPAVERERKRLLGAKVRRQLRCGLLNVAREAQRVPPFAPLPLPPLFDVQVVREVAPELQRLAARLEERPSAARAVALVERMLCSALSPLYGDDAGVLREELRRLEFLLSR